jgi:putative ABC transport system permease protein
MDIATAQWRFGQIGRLQRVDLALADNVSPDEAARSIAAVLPPGAYVATAETEARQSDNLSRAYRVNLNMLALVALLTGAFLVYSAQSLSVVRRTPQFALLRVLGTTRRQLLRQVLTEGLLVGLAGALLGLLLGLALADAALRLLGGDLGGGYFRGDRRPELLFAPSAALVFLALGLVAAIAGSLAPAHNAARAQPAVALKNMGDVVDPRAAPRIAPALALAGAAAAFALLPPVGGLPLFGYLAMALALAGGVAAMPWLARTLLAPLQRLRSAPPAIELALRRLWGAPSQAATALCGIVASTSLMIAMAVMVTSFRGSVDEWLTQVLPADIYLSVQGAGMGFDPRTQAALRDVPGVGSVSFVASTPLRLSPDRPPVALLGEDIDPDDPTEAVPLLGGWRRAPDGLTPVWVSEAVARLYDVDVGDRLLLPAQGASSAETVFVSGVWRDYARQHGAIVINSEDYTRLTGNVLRTNAEIELKDGARPEVVVAALRAALLPEVNRRTAIASPGEIRALSLRIFDRSFAVTYALEAVAILVGLAGVAATFSAQTLARTREFGMLRHIGVARRQIAAMLAAEGALLGTVGVIAGIGLGVAMSQILIHVINPQSFNWTMETRLPLDLFAFVTVALIAAAAGTAVLSGRRALSTDAVRAVREDW